MNRIKLSPLATSPVAKPASQTASRSTLFTSDKQATSAEQETCLFGPLQYEKHYAYPLIVWLHSDGQKSDQLQSILPKISMQNYVGVAPQGAVGNFQCGYHWDQDFDSIQAAQESVFAAIEMACSRFNIAKNRIFLAGLGGGGTMALRIAMNQPDDFAGVIALNGPMPVGHSILSRWKEARQLPVFWAQHKASQGETSAAAMSRNFQQLFSFGFMNLVAREYPTLSDLEGLAPREVNKWIMEQVETAIL